jgi:GDP-L-fucose synthase
MKILITGGSGMVGRNILEYRHKRDYVIYHPTSSELNLLNSSEVYNYLSKKQPDLIIHCAGLVGGIQANIENPFSFYDKNMEMGRNIISNASKLGIKKILNLGSSCMYPKDKSECIREEEMLTGPLEPTNEGYALAKICISKMCEYISKEKFFQYKTIIPCNLYGKWDKFNPTISHMIPAVINKIHKAKVNNESQTIIWGNGNARREFMYVEDLVDFIFWTIPNFDKLDHYTNVGLGYDYTINEYYELIAKIIGYNGTFVHDLSKPEGMKRKLCSIEKINKLGWSPKFTINQGLELTYKFYLNTII